MSRGRPRSGAAASRCLGHHLEVRVLGAQKWLQRMLATTSPTTDAASEVVGFNAALLAYSNAQDAAGALRVLEAALYAVQEVLSGLHLSGAREREGGGAALRNY